MGAGECQDAPRATARGQRVAIPGAQEAVGVELEVQRLPEQTICRDAISFGEDHEISRHHLSPRDASTLAVTITSARGLERSLSASSACSVMVLVVRRHHREALAHFISAIKHAPCQR